MVVTIRKDKSSKEVFAFEKEKKVENFVLFFFYIIKMSLVEWGVIILSLIFLFRYKRKTAIRISFAHYLFLNRVKK